ncbi:LTA synthase family protein [Olivibacter domesticus]|uniref:Phosphoglycerol transferase MdoB n=1 Tax=Olivibacter domesticus TaxID=407022 RepID=A0A1H7MX54_OLID1|nr:alkaline phosphatase family protein [Olivibacter domesticus]SEL15619.1 Phosphoglycerol transferase MdoB [Olivibacter domesticus]
MKHFCSRYSILYGFIILFLFLSFLVRTALLIQSFPEADLSFADIFAIYGKGIVFDLGVALFFVLPYTIYLLSISKTWNSSFANRIITISVFACCVCISIFSFFAEFTFWNEFESRFNFIAVDYLIYTYEVLHNINESYSLPWLIGGVLAITVLLVFLFSRLAIFAISFRADTPFIVRLFHSLCLLLVTAVYIFFISNRWAEKGTNRYQQELSKAGIYSFVDAFRNNELSYVDFYSCHDSREVLATLRTDIKESNSIFIDNDSGIERQILNEETAYKPNVIMVTIESMSAAFMEHFGSKKNLTPMMDRLADSSMLFTDMYATGTRTVRGMEALTLSVPPTPGNSIVRRKDNEGLFNVGTVFRRKGYYCTFFYGGDGYFDNMNSYFSHNGFDIVDHGRSIIPDGEVVTERTIIPENNVHFQNAWGICDEDLFDAVIRQADQEYKWGRHFYHFIMSTSNHRPYTYPENKIDIPSGSGREGAVKYTDYAIGQFMAKARQKAWFRNTIFIFIADHCASSAGKEEITVNKYHIPALIYNLPGTVPQPVSALCSQIDLYPTLFGLLHWNYRSKFFGKNVFDTNYKPRSFISTYQILGFLEGDTLTSLSPIRNIRSYRLLKDNGVQQAIPVDKKGEEAAITYYQGAYDLFKAGKMRQ